MEGLELKEEVEFYRIQCYDSSVAEIERQCLQQASGSCLYLRTVADMNEQRHLMRLGKREQDETFICGMEKSVSTGYWGRV